MLMPRRAAFLPKPRQPEAAPRSGHGGALR